MPQDRVVRKFYLDLTQDEESYIEEVLADMQEKDLSVSPNLKRKIYQNDMVWDDLIKILDEGVPYEVSNEALPYDPDHPYRVVVAKEFNATIDEQFTVFVKIILDPNGEKEVVLDVWKKHGPIPETPPPRSFHEFVNKWDIIPDFESFKKGREYLISA